MECHWWRVSVCVCVSVCLHVCLLSVACIHHCDSISSPQCPKGNTAHGKQYEDAHTNTNAVKFTHQHWVCAVIHNIFTDINMWQLTFSSNVTNLFLSLAETNYLKKLAEWSSNCILFCFCLSLVVFLKSQLWLEILDSCFFGMNFSYNFIFYRSREQKDQKSAMHVSFLGKRDPDLSGRKGLWGVIEVQTNKLCITLILWGITTWCHLK